MAAYIQEPDTRLSPRLFDQRSLSFYLQNRSRSVPWEYKYYGIQDSFYYYVLKEYHRTGSNFSFQTLIAGTRPTAVPWLLLFCPTL